ADDGASSGHLADRLGLGVQPQALDVDQGVGGGEAFLEVVEHIHAAGLEHGEAELLAGKEGRGVVEGLRPGDGERVHAGPPLPASRAARTLSQVIGMPRTGRPMALKTAQATAPAVGTAGGSPRERTPDCSPPPMPVFQRMGSMRGRSAAPIILYISRLGLTMAPTWRSRMRFSWRA